MQNGLWDWYTPLNRVGEEAIDLSRCRRFVVSEYKGHAYGDGLVFYYSQEKNIWIRFRITEDYDEVYNHIGVIHLIYECHPEEAAFEILSHRTYGDRLPDELEEYRRYGEISEYRAWLAQSERRVEEPATQPGAVRPWWDTKTRTVTFGGKVCKQFARIAANQFKILDAFQEKRWVPCVRSPFSSRLELKNAIDSMNAWPGSSVVFTQNGVEVCWAPKE
jgi:hypothetical protein